MKNDINGISTTATGEEQYEFIHEKNRVVIQYDYRWIRKGLFSTIVSGSNEVVALQKARAQMNEWKRTPDKAAGEFPTL